MKRSLMIILMAVCFIGGMLPAGVLHAEEIQTKQQIEETKESAVLKKLTYTFNGDPCEPGVVITWQDRVLEEGVDYTVSYKDNVHVGIGKAIITGMGMFEGSYTLSFTIRKAKQTVSVTVPSKTITVKYKSLKKKAKVLKREKLFCARGFSTAITYKGKTNFSWIQFYNKTGDIYIPKKTPKGTYRITIRVFFPGDTDHLNTYRILKLKLKVK